ncbi:hypothetical protein D307_gp004 [Bacillus phage Bastille]|uniref:Uncharacterized protein n=2 Tax=Bastillevirus TaxID=1918010 RepID=J9PLX5_9CAUD|nr:hypothetical protein D307_gp004 [Bacillus phage Bastille]AEQ34460.1 hypothetical protein [Bacillus phage Bastille]ASR79847.1 hypothetical protein JANET_59 [Bacillus phage Janet]ASU00908.1 hypothetical protein ANTHONY_61 [Bacillus phage Anthony]AZF89160.1 hypothetical protein Goe5_c00520 [Bacillus phage vB_BthM-Goe5]
MLYKFITIAENDKEYEFTKTGDTMQEAEDKIPQEADRRGIVHNLSVVDRFSYEVGGKWVRDDGSYEEDLKEAEAQYEDEQWVEHIDTHEEEGQLTFEL